MTKGQERSKPRKDLSKVFRGMPYSNQLIGNREGVLGYFVRCGYAEERVTLEYHTEGNLKGVAKELPLLFLSGGKEREIIYKEVPKPKYEIKF